MRSAPAKRFAAGLVLCKKIQYASLHIDIGCKFSVWARTGFLSLINEYSLD